ncbi:MAG: aryl-sulfate sulfotransferase [Lentimicrobiaceae bacterium]|nr:aryl-sulfate sulfotransferase [Lentimicrobiaceae bacterium]
MKTTKLILAFFVAFAMQKAMSQEQTVGIFLNTPDAFNGYTLFSPQLNTTTYLIDNCGEVVNKWESDRTPGRMAFLTPDGNLVRAKATDNTVFKNGIAGGAIEIFNWEGERIWEYFISDDFQCQHHDIEYLPNGNILAIVWEYRTLEELIQVGRVNAQSDIWSEKIVEIQPDFENGIGTIVWEWRVWDHLIQDVDPSIDNYGVVEDNPQRIDINYLAEKASVDWLHFNGIDYNAELDQIAISIHQFSEMWIIDHSTTTEEAATSVGGNCGKGGDLLYRWGNPIAYKRGTANDQKLFMQHDANWIPDGQMDGGMIMIYSNRAGTPYGLQYSSVVVIDPPLLEGGNYLFENTAYAPADFHWSYTAENPSDFYSALFSGANRLPNNNTIICEALTGRLFEVDYDGNIVWQYINPVAQDGIIPQYVQPQANTNSVFQTVRYAPDFEGFIGRELIPQGHIEPGTTTDCEIYSGANVEKLYADGNFYVFPNPASSLLNVQWDYTNIDKIQLTDIKGNILIETPAYTNSSVIDVSCFNEGVYIISLLNKGYLVSSKQVIIK